jgi:outer membrane protein TolC
MLAIRGLILACIAYLASIGPASAQERLPPREAPIAGPIAMPLPKPRGVGTVLPINLATALRLANVRPIDVQVASQEVQRAAALLQRAKTLWLPTLYLGADYTRHDGQLQDVVGSVFGTSKSSLMGGVGPVATFALTDALYAPLASRQDLDARRASWQASQNDVMLSVADAYFNVQQARGEVIGAVDALQRAEELSRRTEKLSPALILPVEAVRARAELARRKQVVSLAQERWRTTSAQLVRLLRLDAGALVEPIEPPNLMIHLIKSDIALDDLIPLALTHRPELAAQQGLVQATLTRLKQEKMRPLMPSLLLRGTSTPQGTLSAGVFGGGIDSHMGKFSARSDWDVQLVWEIQNLGFGNAARVKERKAENEIALLRLFQWQDTIAAEVVEAHAQAQESRLRVADAEAGLKDAIESAEKNFEAMNQTKRVGEVVLLVVRPQEAIAAVQALQQAYNDYFAAVTSYDRAQFRLYRALGHPAQCMPALQE